MVPILFMGARLALHYKSIGVSGKQTHKVQRIGHGPCRVSGPRKKKNGKSPKTIYLVYTTRQMTELWGKSSQVRRLGWALPAIHGSPAPQLLPLPFLSLHYQSIIEECLSTVVSFLTRQQPTILFWEMGLWTGTDWLQYSSPTLTECGTTFPQMGPWQWSWSDFSRWCYLPRTTTVAVGGSSS